MCLAEAVWGCGSRGWNKQQQQQQHQNQKHNRSSAAVTGPVTADTRPGHHIAWGNNSVLVCIRAPILPNHQLVPKLESRWDQKLKARALV